MRVRQHITKHAAAPKHVRATNVVVTRTATGEAVTGRPIEVTVGEVELQKVLEGPTADGDILQGREEGRVAEE